MNSLLSRLVGDAYWYTDLKGYLCPLSGGSNWPNAVWPTWRKGERRDKVYISFPKHNPSTDVSVDALTPGCLELQVFWSLGSRQRKILASPSLLPSTWVSGLTFLAMWLSEAFFPTNQKGQMILIGLALWSFLSFGPDRTRCGLGSWSHWPDSGTVGLKRGVYRDGWPWWMPALLKNQRAQGGAGEREIEQVRAPLWLTKDPQPTDPLLRFLLDLDLSKVDRHKNWVSCNSWKKYLAWQGEGPWKILITFFILHWLPPLRVFYFVVTIWSISTHSFFYNKIIFIM